jgi:hypothetical protein
MKSQYDSDGYYEPHDTWPEHTGYELQPRLALYEHEQALRHPRRTPFEHQDAVIGAMVLARLVR